MEAVTKAATVLNLIKEIAISKIKVSKENASYGQTQNLGWPWKL